MFPGINFAKTDIEYQWPLGDQPATDEPWAMGVAICQPLSKYRDSCLAQVLNISKPGLALY